MGSLRLQRRCVDQTGLRPDLIVFPIDDVVGCPARMSAETLSVSLNLVDDIISSPVSDAQQGVKLRILHHRGFERAGMVKLLSRPRKECVDIFSDSVHSVMKFAQAVQGVRRL